MLKKEIFNRAATEGRPRRRGRNPTKAGSSAGMESARSITQTVAEIKARSNQYECARQSRRRSPGASSSAGPPRPRGRRGSASAPRRSPSAARSAMRTTDEVTTSRGRLYDEDIPLVARPAGCRRRGLRARPPGAVAGPRSSPPAPRHALVSSVGPLPAHGAGRRRVARTVSAPPRSATSRRGRVAPVLQQRLRDRARRAGGAFGAGPVRAFQGDAGLRQTPERGATARLARRRGVVEDGAERRAARAARQAQGHDRHRSGHAARGGAAQQARTPTAHSRTQPTRPPRPRLARRRAALTRPRPALPRP